MDMKNLFSSVQENPLPEDVYIHGTIPVWLRGVYYKVGNGKFDLQNNFTMTHAFDGFAILYQFKIDDKKIKYRSRYLNSTAYKKAMSVGKPLHTEFGTRSYPDPNKNFFARILSSVVPGDLTDNDAVNLFMYRGKMYAVSETCFIHQIDTCSLQSIAKIDLSKIGVNLTSSHFLQGKNGSIFNMGTSFMGGLKYHLYTFSPNDDTGNAAARKPNETILNDKDDKDKDKDTKSPNVATSSRPYDSDPMKDAKILATVPSSWKTSFSYTHSFGMSEGYFIIIEQPLLVNSVKLLASQVQGKALRDCMDWSPQEKTRFTLVDRATGTVVKIKYVSPAFFFFHVVNAYDDGGNVVVDVLASNTPVVLERMCLSKLRSNEGDATADPPIIHRFIIPIINIKEIKSKDNIVKLKTSKASAIKVKEDTIELSPECLDKPGLEMPRINSNYMGQKYRYVYGSGMYHDSNYRQSLCKIDLEEGGDFTKIWREQECHFLGEPQFVPNPEATSEDDGVVLATMTNSQKRRNSLIILDAKLFTEIARAEFTSDIPVGNHGIFVFNEEM